MSYPHPVLGHPRARLAIGLDLALIAACALGAWIAPGPWSIAPAALGIVTASLLAIGLRRALRRA